jgi:hypothetical protein
MLKNFVNLPKSKYIYSRCSTNVSYEQEPGRKKKRYAFIYKFEEKERQDSNKKKTSKHVFDATTNLEELSLIAYFQLY